MPLISFQCTIGENKMSKWFAECPSTAYRKKHPGAKARISQKVVGPNAQYGHAFGPYATKAKATQVAQYQGYNT
jgi:hypothetical protein